MESRLKYWTLAPEGVKALSGVYKYVHDSGLDPALLNIVFLRVSQINGCAFCVDLHTRDALKGGESFRRLNAVVTWHEAPFFTPRERAALAWAESLTLIAQTRASDAEYRAVREHFNDKELVDLSVAISLMNLYNRMAIGFRRPPPAEEA